MSCNGIVAVKGGRQPGSADNGDQPTICPVLFDFSLDKSGRMRIPREACSLSSTVLPPARWVLFSLMARSCYMVRRVPYRPRTTQCHYYGHFFIVICWIQLYSDISTMATARSYSEVSIVVRPLLRVIFDMLSLSERLRPDLQADLLPVYRVYIRSET